MYLSDNYFYFEALKYFGSFLSSCHDADSHLDDFGDDLGTILGALRCSGAVDVLLLQEEGD